MSTLFDNTMKKLEKAIEERGSIRSMAERLDLNPSTVSRWFAENRSPDFRGLAIILEYLGVQILFPGENGQSQNVPDTNELAEQIQRLKNKNKELHDELLRREGAIQVLKEQLEKYQHQAQGSHFLSKD